MWLTFNVTETRNDSLFLSICIYCRNKCIHTWVKSATTAHVKVQCVLGPQVALCPLLRPKWCWHTLYEENMSRTYHISSCPVSSCIRVQPRTTRHRLKRDVWESSTSDYLFWFKIYEWRYVWESAKWRVTMHWRKGQWICAICRISSLPGVRLSCLLDISGCSKGGNFYQAVNSDYQRGRQQIDGDTHPTKRRFKISGHEMRSRTRAEINWVKRLFDSPAVIENVQLEIHEWPPVQRCRHKY